MPEGEQRFPDLGGVGIKTQGSPWRIVRHQHSRCDRRIVDDGRGRERAPKGAFDCIARNAARPQQSGVVQARNDRRFNAHCAGAGVDDQIDAPAQVRENVRSAGR